MRLASILLGLVVRVGLRGERLVELVVGLGGAGWIVIEVLIGVAVPVVGLIDGIVELVRRSTGLV